MAVDVFSSKSTQIGGFECSDDVFNSRLFTPYESFTSSDSSVGRAVDCSVHKTWASIGRWFKSGSEDAN
ncbi:hypothetical protein M514_20638 [Trichuris suis]|uniref:Uncharacterized protein n=1 Tax=Trichuris suis TaxID=68888 RepID=A0A085NCK6_9BILA|nr:hypothetical protein M514_20638 [Trichuris suis]